MQTRNKGVFWGYKTEITIATSKGTYKFSDHEKSGYGGKIIFELPFNTDGSVNYVDITFYNLSKAHAEVFKNKRRFTIKSGPEELFGKLAEGTIISHEEEQRDGADYSIKVRCLVGKDYSKDAKIYSYASGSKKTKHSFTIKKGEVIKWNTKKKVKVKLSFRKGTKSSTIIKRICRQSGIKISPMDLKKDKVNKKAYTVGPKPYSALKKLAKACGSKLYYRRDGLVIDSFGKANPYKENIYLDETHGIESMTINEDDDGKTTYSVTTALDPRIDAGSVVYISYDGVKGWFRVLNGSHNSDAYTTEFEAKKID
ncbi:hypothetical protein FD13_GL000298 [Levilactobacillus senmaizukei DSM 21775 = NBRC 103853]|uniref:Uncharacterized protein n=1 Tax=Levilactobacillus senmaizukei DSM 21775 = NBRC 103853 TaxID=1423803 RepID=A0A0R2DDX5_9LACO|nr:hypothetical protein FD13_GL000298 [Levilactobacillus senmaizukei DSM 21775 = NBRC 103853]